MKPLAPARLAALEWWVRDAAPLLGALGDLRPAVVAGRRRQVGLAGEPLYHRDVGAGVEEVGDAPAEIVRGDGATSALRARRLRAS